MCSPKILLLVFLYAFIFCTAPHLRLAGCSLLAANTSLFLTAAKKFSRVIFRIVTFCIVFDDLFLN